MRIYRTLVDSLVHFYGVQKRTILDNVMKPLISPKTTHDKKFKCDSKFSSKYPRNVYEVEQLSDDENEV